MTRLAIAPMTACAINGTELRASIVGEGGNLGMTQRGRIEFARTGGLLNTDAIDNAGGVHSSDYEVNLKILLDQEVSAQDLTAKQRNRLLASMTDEVAALVLQQNYQQCQVLSLARRRASMMIDDHRRLIHLLENEGRLKRKLEFSADRRTARGAGAQWYGTDPTGDLRATGLQQTAPVRSTDRQRHRRRSGPG